MSTWLPGVKLVMLTWLPGVKLVMSTWLPGVKSVMLTWLPGVKLVMSTLLAGVKLVMLTLLPGVKLVILTMIDSWDVRCWMKLLKPSLSASQLTKLIELFTRWETEDGTDVFHSRDCVKSQIMRSSFMSYQLRQLCTVCLFKKVSWIFQKTRNAFCGTWYLPHSCIHNERIVPIIMADALRMHRMSIFPLPV